MGEFQRKQEAESDWEFRTLQEELEEESSRDALRIREQQQEEQQEVAGEEISAVQMQTETTPGAVPVSASAPKNLHAQASADFQKKLLELTGKANDADNLVSALHLKADIETEFLTVIDGFRNYANLRDQLIQGIGSVQDIDLAVQDFRRALDAVTLRKNGLEAERKSLVGKGLQQPEIARMADILQDKALIRRAESIMKPYMDFVEADRYQGGLNAPLAICHDDVRFKIKDPTIEIDATGIYNVTYEFLDQSFLPLFAKPPCLEDINQGALGDCYLLAGLASIVATAPDLIVNAMRDMGTSVRVRFFDDTGIPRDVEVQKSIPVKRRINQRDPRDDTMNYVFATGSLWVQMMEKAYTASGLRTYSGPGTNVDYATIEGGFAGKFVEQLTGRKMVSRDMANRSVFDPGNSLLGTYMRYFTNLRKGIDPKIAGIDPEIAEIVRKELTVKKVRGISGTGIGKVATAIYERHKESAGLSRKAAVGLAVQMAEEEDYRVRMVTDSSGKTVRTLVRPSYIDDLYSITGIASIQVPDDHVFDEAETGRILAAKHIHTEPAGEMFQLFDTLSDGIKCSEEIKRLAFRIQGVYLNKGIFLAMDDAVGVAGEYERYYRKSIADRMVKELKKDSDVILAYRPFSVRKSNKSGIRKERYTHRAKEFYQSIEDAIARGKIVTASTVDYRKNGDRAKKEGLVEGHAYSVLGTEEKDGGKYISKYIRVRNPWGEYERVYNKNGRAQIAPDKHGGTFLMELNDFMANFNELEIN